MSVDGRLQMNSSEAFLFKLITGIDEHVVEKLIHQHVERKYELADAFAKSDMYAAGKTLLFIARTSSMRHQLYNIAEALMSDDMKYSEVTQVIDSPICDGLRYIGRHIPVRTMRLRTVQEGGGCKNKPTTQWVSTRRKVSIKGARGKPTCIRTLFRHSTTGEQRVRKVVAHVDGTRRVAYVRYTLL